LIEQEGEMRILMALMVAVSMGVVPRAVPVEPKLEPIEAAWEIVVPDALNPWLEGEWSR
jgi:hypothetical protein